MTAPDVGIAIDAEAAADWVRGSLAQGSFLAMLMTTRLASLSSARLLVPSTDAGEVGKLDDDGRGIRQSDVALVARRVLEHITGRLETLIVESDVARRGDRHLSPDVAFVEDRVLRWTDLADVDEAVVLLRRGASGYPLNAYGCVDPAGDLGLRAGQTLDGDDLARVCASTCLVVVSVYDGEAFVALLNPDLEVRLG
jgi:hypothetical protein